MRGDSRAFMERAGRSPRAERARSAGTRGRAPGMRTIAARGGRWARLSGAERPDPRVSAAWREAERKMHATHAQGRARRHPMKGAVLRARPWACVACVPRFRGARRSAPMRRSGKRPRQFFLWVCGEAARGMRVFQRPKNCPRVAGSAPRFRPWEAQSSPGRLVQ